MVVVKVRIGNRKEQIIISLSGIVVVVHQVIICNFVSLSISRCRLPWIPPGIREYLRSVRNARNARDREDTTTIMMIGAEQTQSNAPSSPNLRLMAERWMTWTSTTLIYSQISIGFLLLLYFYFYYSQAAATRTSRSATFGNWTNRNKQPKIWSPDSRFLGFWFLVAGKLNNLTYPLGPLVSFLYHYHIHSSPSSLIGD